MALHGSDQTAQRKPVGHCQVYCSDICTLLNRCDFSGFLEFTQSDPGKIVSHSATRELKRDLILSWEDGNLHIMLSH